MSTPTDSPLDELRALRERAYGPDADIHDDPVALARLEELQEQERFPVGPIAAEALNAPADPSPAPTEHSAPSADERTAEPAAEGAVAEEPGESDPQVAHARPWWRRRIPLLWAGSVVAGLLLGVALTLGVQAIDAGRVAVLQEDPEAEWPDEWFGSRPPDGRLFEEFHGLTVIVFPQSYGPDGSQHCLYVVTPDQNGGFGAGSCGADAYPATASMEVGSLSPAELRDAFPDGTALQFVHDGSTVDVYSRAPSIVEPTP